MKRVLRTLLIVALVAFAALLCLCMTACGNAPETTQYCYDDMGLFDETQEQAINQAARQAHDKYGATVLVATCKRYGSRAEVNGEEFMRMYGLNDNLDYIVIIVNATGPTTNYHFDIYTYGKYAVTIKDSEIELVLDTCDDQILSSNPATASEGVRVGIDLLGQAAKGRIAGISTFAIVVGAIVLGLVVAGLCAGGVARSYSRKRKNVTYPLEKYAQLNLKEREDRFVNSVTTFVVISNNSGSGGHSSGGGGGGGHRGGR